MLKLFDNVSISYSLSISTVVNGNPEDILFANSFYNKDKNKVGILLSDNCLIHIPTQNNKTYTLTEIAERAVTKNNIIEDFIRIGSSENNVLIDNYSITIKEGDSTPIVISTDIVNIRGIESKNKIIKLTPISGNNDNISLTIGRLNDAYSSSFVFTINNEDVFNITENDFFIRISTAGKYKKLIGNDNGLFVDDNEIITKLDITPRLVSFNSSATNNICTIIHNYGQCPSVRVYQTDSSNQYIMTYPTIHNWKNDDDSYTLEVIFDDSSSNSYVIAINH